mmetsp:Transcript_16896/g.32698  ORF Transcript_16896/g.32698 Transcript_16896/m.32698 type:complete len:479 (+) Transcript_16896:237-1673(+)
MQTPSPDAAAVFSADLALVPVRLGHAFPSRASDLLPSLPGGALLNAAISPSRPRRLRPWGRTLLWTLRAAVLVPFVLFLLIIFTAFAVATFIFTAAPRASLCALRIVSPQSTLCCLRGLMVVLLCILIVRSSLPSRLQRLLQSRLTLFCEPARLQSLVQLALLAQRDLVKGWSCSRFILREVELACEVDAQTLGVALKVHARVGVRHGHHLREVDHSQPLFIVNQQIEFVQVAVDEAELNHARHHAHHLRVDVHGILQVPHLREGVALDHGHEHAVPVHLDGVGHGEAVVLQRAHEGELLERRQTRQVQPVVVVSVLQVVPLVLDCAEGGAAETVKLERERVARLVDHLEDVRLLAHADLAAHAHDDPLADETLDGQVVVPEVREAVPVVVLVLVVNQLVAQQVLDLAVRTPVFEASDAVDELHRHKLVVLHPHLHCCQHTPVVPFHVTKDIDIKLHSYAAIRDTRVGVDCAASLVVE